MVGTIVLYSSISGYTKKYAKWIAEELKAEIYDIRQKKIEKLSNYDLIIFGGSLHASGINGVETIKEKLHSLANKKDNNFCCRCLSSKRKCIRRNKKQKLHFDTTRGN